MQRLNKFIASSGYTSRRKADELITNGKVKINGKVVRELGIKVDMMIIQDMFLEKKKL